ncbi:MAG: hypothetical protein Q4C41_00140 [Eggerthellaceae bacterium]|nr:hypothetical protein [Eggerthellaceae bacterium]
MAYRPKAGSTAPDTITPETTHAASAASKAAFSSEATTKSGVVRSLGAKQIAAHKARRKRT